ncbi:MAG TPA: hypothetical protein VK635_24860, partial [Bradyrhizobium sp.]|nr:hypothetical protein [Bradyrhizobium sp.]
AGSDWLHEIKYDGYRMHARLDHGKVQLLTRTGLDWSNLYPYPVSALRALRAKTAYIDGELCAPSADGAPSFGLLQAAMDQGRTNSLVFFAFDLLYLDGVLKPLETPRMPLDKPPPRENRFSSPLELSRVHWVRPEVVVEVTYLTWTEGGLLRAVSYQGQREDKPASQVVRPIPHPL